MPSTIRLHRVIATKPEKVFRAFVESDAVASWLPPYGFLCTVHELDAKVGGRHRMSFRNFTTGQSHSFGGTYVELVPGKRIVYTDAFDDANLPGEMRTTVTLKAVSVGTEDQHRAGRRAGRDPGGGLLPRLAGFAAKTREARRAGDQRIAATSFRCSLRSALRIVLLEDAAGQPGEIGRRGDFRPIRARMLPSMVRFSRNKSITAMTP